VFARSYPKALSFSGCNRKFTLQNLYLSDSDTAHTMNTIEQFILRDCYTENYYVANAEIMFESPTTDTAVTTAGKKELRAQFRRRVRNGLRCNWDWPVFAWVVCDRQVWGKPWISQSEHAPVHAYGERVRNHTAILVSIGRRHPYLDA
jgi:hypothetical protein